MYIEFQDDLMYRSIYWESFTKYEKHFFRIFDKKLFKSDDTSSYQYNGLNVSVTWNKDYGPSFGVAREHYWDDSDKRIEECSRLDKLSFNQKVV